MKTQCKNQFLLPVLVTGIGFLLAGRVTAQTFTTLHSFGFIAGVPADVGAFPLALIVSGGTLYGTTEFGGTSGSGTVFAVNIDGTGFRVLYSFSEIPAFVPYTNSDGAGPNGLVLSGSTLYGTTGSGGISGNGTVFAVNADGSGFTTLYSFTATAGPFPGTNSDGSGPNDGLLLSGNTLYGTTISGGIYGLGTVYALNIDGTGFRSLHCFSAGMTNSSGINTNSDGAEPADGLTLSGNTLYGTTWGGGSSGDGTIFAANTDGSGFTTLFNFNDGSETQAGPLILSSNILYGTEAYSGTNFTGTVFAIKTDGTGYRPLYNFTGASDGSGPGGLSLSKKTLYGTTSGGTGGGGTVFAVNTDGSGFTTLYSFTATAGFFHGTNSDGSFPVGISVLSGNTLYGGTISGGDFGYGTIFSVPLPAAVSPPTLTITPSGANVILTWATDVTGFTLQSTTNLASPIWTTNLPAPLLFNGQFTVTNSISGTQQFFRLSQ